MTWDPLQGAPAARERQRRTFERTAEEYDRYRPTYPDALFTDILGYAGLVPHDRILEIGCGTGRATLPLAGTGNPLLGIEPAAAMAGAVRAKLADHPNVAIRTSSFEEAGIERRAFGLVACAQAYHWLDPATRVERVADALRPGGAAAIFANIQVWPDDTGFHQRVQDVYRRIVPELAHQGPLRRPDELPSHPLEGSARFTDLHGRSHPWSQTLSTADYVGLLSTHSPYAALEPDVRDRLMAEIADLLDAEFGGRVTEHYVAFLALARAV